MESAGTVRSRRILRRHKDRSNKIEKAAVTVAIGGKMRRVGKGRWLWINVGCCCGGGSGGIERGILQPEKKKILCWKKKKEIGSVNCENDFTWIEGNRGEDGA